MDESLWLEERASRAPRRPPVHVSQSRARPSAPTEAPALPSGLTDISDTLLVCMFTTSFECADRSHIRTVASIEDVTTNLQAGVRLHTHWDWGS